MAHSIGDCLSADRISDCTPDLVEKTVRMDKFNPQNQPFLRGLDITSFEQFLALTGQILERTFATRF
jgi:hypothetical protein